MVFQDSNWIICGGSPISKYYYRWKLIFPLDWKHIKLNRFFEINCNFCNNTSEKFHLIARIGNFNMELKKHNIGQIFKCCNICLLKKIPDKNNRKMRCNRCLFIHQNKQFNLCPDCCYNNGPIFNYFQCPHCLIWVRQFDNQPHQCKSRVCYICNNLKICSHLIRGRYFTCSDCWYPGISKVLFLTCCDNIYLEFKKVKNVTYIYHDCLQDECISHTQGLCLNIYCKQKQLINCPECCKKLSKKSFLVHRC